MTQPAQRIYSREHFLVALASATPLGAQVIISLFVSHLGGERSLGQLLIASNVVGLFVLVGDAGVGSAFLRLGRDTIQAQRAAWVWSSRLAAVTATSVSLIVCVIASPTIATRLGRFSVLDLVTVSCAGYFSVLSADELSVEAAIGSTSQWAIRSILRSTINLVGLVVALVLLDTSIYSAVLVGSLSGFFATVLFFRGRFGPVTVNRDAFKGVLRQGSGLTLGVALGTGAILLAPLIASSWLDLSEIGKLRAAMLLSGGLLSVASSALASVFLPRMASLSGKPRDRLMTRTLALAGAAATTFAILPSFGFVMTLLKVAASDTQRNAWVAIAISDGVRMVAYVLAYVCLATGSVRSFLLREACNGSFLVIAVLSTHSGGLVELSNAYLAAAAFSLAVNAFWAFRSLERATRKSTGAWTLVFLGVTVTEIVFRTSAWLPAVAIGGLGVLVLAGHQLTARPNT